MATLPQRTTLFGHLEAMGDPPAIGRRVWRAAGTGAFVVLALSLLAGACAFAFGLSRTLFDRALLPGALVALLGLAGVQRLAGRATAPWSTPARTVLSLLFLLGALCFVNEAWSFLRQGLPTGEGAEAGHVR